MCVRACMRACVCVCVCVCVRALEGAREGGSEGRHRRAGQGTHLLQWEKGALPGGQLAPLAAQTIPWDAGDRAQVLQELLGRKVVSITAVAPDPLRARGGWGVVQAERPVEGGRVPTAQHGRSTYSTALPEHRTGYFSEGGRVDV